MFPQIPHILLAGFSPDVGVIFMSVYSRSVVITFENLEDRGGCENSVWVRGRLWL